jgi:hypothetical protein
MTFSLKTTCIMTDCIMTLVVTLSIKDSGLNDTRLKCSCHYNDCHYAEWHDVEWYYAECILLSGIMPRNNLQSLALTDSNLIFFDKKRSISSSGYSLDCSETDCDKCTNLKKGSINYHHTDV